MATTASAMNGSIEDTPLVAGGPIEWVKLKSSDGYDFMVPKQVALGSGTIKSALDDSDSFQEAKLGQVSIPHRGIIVAKIVEYLLYRFNYRNTATKDITEDFSDRIEPEIALELLMAADYMET